MTAAKAAVTTACKGFESVAAVASAKTALDNAITGCADATALTTYWNGTDLVGSNALVTALTTAVTAALNAAKTAANSELDDAAAAAKVGLDESADAAKITAIDGALSTAKGNVSSAETKGAIDTAVTNGKAAITAAKG